VVSFGKKHFKNALSETDNLFVFRYYVHAGRSRLGAGRLHHGAVDFDHADAAGAGFADLRMVAQVRHIKAVLQRYLENGLALAAGDLHPVDRELDFVHNKLLLLSCFFPGFIPEQTVRGCHPWMKPKDIV